MKPLFILLFSICVTAALQAQSPSFNLLIDVIEWPGLTGTQAYAYAEYNGKYLVVGGRTDGLHRRQPFAAFDAAGRNNVIRLLHFETQQEWLSDLADVEPTIREQLSSTNMQYFQDGNMLYIVGGYGYSETFSDHITFPYLTAIDVPGMIAALENGNSILPFIRQINAEDLVVTGGYLNKMGDIFYLSGGHRFDGNYNPMGNPTFTQTYTNAVRRFTIEDNGVDLSYTLLEEWYDEDLMHRRDYNVVPQHHADGTTSLVAFSGVFQINLDVPYLTAVEITEVGMSEIPDFFQYYNHYHCAHLPLYSESENEMYNVFFGGMAQYTDVNGTLTLDNNVPFVNTIACVTRSSEGSWSESKFEAEMPGLLGSASELMLLNSIPVFEDGTVDVDALEGDTVLIGYIYGGIESSQGNIFFINDGTQSVAQDNVFAVYLMLNGIVNQSELNEQSILSLAMQVYPNPADDMPFVQFNVMDTENWLLEIVDTQGKIVTSKKVEQLSLGKNTLLLAECTAQGTYIIRLSNNTISAEQRLVIH